MPYPLIILGAGASYDYSSFGKHAPLTNSLVSPPYLHTGLLRNYAGAGNLLGDIRPKIIANTYTFEQALTEEKEDNKHSREMLKHFVALEFYLKDLFTDISLSDATADMVIRHEVNNYKTLLRRIDNYCEEKAVIVTFNYDSLLERNLNRNKPKAMKDYIRHGIKIFKLHGSHDWVYVHRKDNFWHEQGNNSFQAAMGDPELFESLKTNHHAEYEPAIKELDKNGEYFCFPAIAVPVIGKDSYICPPQHTTTLEAEINKIDRILIIGWKAGDPSLLELLKKYDNCREAKVLVVCGKLKESEETAEVIKRALPDAEIEAYDGGFSDFMGSDKGKDFFK
jgi:hypothetical protein